MPWFNFHSNHLFREIMEFVRSQGRVIVSALPQEAVTANIVRRVLKIIREEYDSAQVTNKLCCVVFVWFFYGFFDSPGTSI